MVEIDRPDILIVEGLNVLQTGAAAAGRQGDPVRLRLLRLLGLSRRRRGRAARAGTSTASCTLRETAFRDPQSYFHRYSRADRRRGGRDRDLDLDRINLVNLRENILPTRQRADLILKKGASHLVEEVALRRL